MHEEFNSVLARSMFKELPESAVEDGVILVGCISWLGGPSTKATKWSSVIAKRGQNLRQENK